MSPLRMGSFRQSRNLRGFECGAYVLGRLLPAII